MTQVLIGTSGFNYKHWSNGVFYPPRLPQSKWLAYYCEHFDTVELNVSFYRLPALSTFEKWRNETGDNFTFAIKGSRFITHVKKLKDCRDPLNIFFENARGLLEKLEIVLWQFPENLKKNNMRLLEFAKLLKENKTSARAKHAFEFRHESWFVDDVYQILKVNNFALVIAHSAVWPTREVSTASYVYLRFHGPSGVYSSSYSDRELESWAKKIKKWLVNSKDIYAYFNNDDGGFAVKNAQKLKELVGF